MDFDRIFNTVVAQEYGYPARIDMNRRTLDMVATATKNDQMAIRAETGVFDTNGIVARYTGVPLYIDETIQDGYMRVTPPPDNTNDPIMVHIEDTGIGTDFQYGANYHGFNVNDLVIRDGTFRRLDDGTAQYVFNMNDGTRINVPIEPYIYDEYRHDAPDTAWVHEYQLTPVDFNEHITANYDVVFDPHEFTEEVQRITERAINEAINPANDMTDTYPAKKAYRKETPAKTEEDVPDIHDEDFLEVLKGA